MNTFYFYDGQNEAGPFTVDELKGKKLTRNTPIRLMDSDKWMPAEKISGLKEVVAPRKIKRPKDVVPVVAERISQLHYQKPRTLYGALLGVALLAGLSFYSIGKATGKNSAKAVAVASPQSLSLQGVSTANEATSGEKNKKQSTEAQGAKEDAAKASRLRWSKLITATNSNYGIGFLGGIKDLSVIVHNNSDYTLDEVVAKVTYIKAGGGVWKTVPVTLYAVPPHESIEKSLPDVSRGKKVKVSLHKILSRKMNFNYTEGQKGKDSGDPYYKES